MSNKKSNSIPGPSYSESVRAVPLSDTDAGPRNGLHKVKDNTFYFQHDNTSHSDEKVLDLRAELGYEGYGIYWALLELLHQNDGIMQMNSKRIAFAMQVDEDNLIKVINNFGLFVIKGEKFYSNRLLRQIKYRAEIVEKRREAGAIGGKKKANAKQMLSNELPKERKGKESKVKENKKDISVFWADNLDEFEYLNKSFSKMFLFKLPLEYAQHRKLIDKYGIDRVKEKYMAIQNSATVLKKNESAYLTTINWLSR